MGEVGVHPKVTPLVSFEHLDLLDFFTGDGQVGRSTYDPLDQDPTPAASSTHTAVAEELPLR